MDFHRACPVGGKAAWLRRVGLHIRREKGLCHAGVFLAKAALADASSLGGRCLIFISSWLPWGLQAETRTPAQQEMGLSGLGWAGDSTAVPVKQNPPGREGKEGFQEEETPSDPSLCCSSVHLPEPQPPHLSTSSCTKWLPGSPPTWKTPRFPVCHHSGPSSHLTTAEVTLFIKSS